MDIYKKYTGDTPLTWRKVSCQAMSDWFGKDVQSGYTRTYIWMANELGHVAIGFVGVQIIYWLVYSIALVLNALLGTAILAAPYDNPWGWPLWLSGLWFLFWFFKEYADVVGERKDALDGLFAPDTRGITFDAWTAVFFFFYGTLLAQLSLAWPTVAFLVVLALFLFPIQYLARYWLTEKMTFQQAVLPFQYRLSNFPKGVFGGDSVAYNNARNSISGLLARRWPAADDSSEQQPAHLLIFGPLNAGKTSLAVGIGTENAYKLGKTRYLTFVKFLQKVRNREQVPTKQEGKVVWAWQDADLLIIDDVNPGGDPNQAEDDVAVINSDNFARKLKALDKEVKARLRERRTVWVLGELPNLSADKAQNYDRYHDYKKRWSAPIADLLATDVDKLGVIELKKALELRDELSAIPPILSRFCRKP